MTGAPNLANVPEELRALRRWVTWRSERRGTRMTKRPRQSATKPDAWLAASAACNRVACGEADGVGFVLGDGVVCVDLDDCIHDHGTLHEIARDAVALGSYVERSPSGRGLHVLIRASISRSRNIGACDGVPCHEIYDGQPGSARYVTVTGDRVGDVSVLRKGPEARAALDAFVAKWFSTESEAARRDLESGRDKVDLLDDEAVLRGMFAEKNGPKWRRLYDGDCSGFPSQSEADLALCRKLRFYTSANAAQMDRLFRRSKLMRAKWDQRRGTQTYGEITIGKILAAGGPTYAPRVAPIDRGAARRRAATKWAKVPLWWTYALQGAGELAFRAVCVIAAHADKNGEAYPSIATIAVLCGVSERRVQIAIRKIQVSGVMSIVPRVGTSNLYRLAVRVPEAITPYVTWRQASGVMESGTLRVTPVVPPKRPRTDQELDTGERTANGSENEEPDADPKVIAFPEPCIPLRPSARALRDDMLRGTVGLYALGITENRTTG